MTTKNNNKVSEMFGARLVTIAGYDFMATYMATPTEGIAIAFGQIQAQRFVTWRIWVENGEVRGEYGHYTDDLGEAYRDFNARSKALQIQQKNDKEWEAGK